MKKLLLLLAVFSMSSIITLSREIIPEYYMMERLLLSIEASPVYQFMGTEKLEDFETIKAIQVNDEVLKAVGTSENPFYMVNSNNRVTAVRIGDYLASPVTLSSIYFIPKASFEENYYDPNAVEPSLEAQEDSTINELTDTTSVDETNNSLDSIEE